MTKTDIYICDAVSGILQLYPYLSDPKFRKLTIADQLDRQAATLHTAHNSGDRRVLFQLGSWWPAALRQPHDEIMAASFTKDDAHLTIAREYGFADWAAVEAATPTHIDPNFEQAVDAVINGDIATLDTLLTDNADLVRDTSRYGHSATLLHYLGANGVESWRQQTPLNAAAVASALIAYGADVNAHANMYGGGNTAFDLATTSAHPAAANVLDDLAAVLKPA